MGEKWVQGGRRGDCSFLGARGTSRMPPVWQVSLPVLLLLLLLCELGGHVVDAQGKLHLVYGSHGVVELG